MEKNKLAYISLYTGSASLFLFLFGLLTDRFWQMFTFISVVLGLTGGIVAAILGNTARRQIRAANGSKRDRSMAVLGINLGLLPLLFLCIYLIVISLNLY